MANFNKVILVGRLTRDVETRTFGNGGMVANFGFVVNGRAKDKQTGEWKDEPMFIDCSVFNRGESGKLADLVRDHCKKGSQILIEGKLVLESWDDKNNPGQRRSKHKIIVDAVQLLDPRQQGEGGGRQQDGEQQRHGNGQQSSDRSPTPSVYDPDSIPF